MLQLGSYSGEASSQSIDSEIYYSEILASTDILNQIVWLFYRDVDLLEDDIDYQEILRKQIELLWKAFSSLNDSQIKEIYRTFPTVNTVTEKDVDGLVRSIRSIYQNNNPEKKLDFAKQIILPFDISYGTTIHGSMAEGNLLELALTRRGGFYKLHFLEYPILRKSETKKPRLTLISGELESIDITGSGEGDIKNPRASRGEEGAVHRRPSRAKEGRIRRRQKKKEGIVGVVKNNETTPPVDIEKFVNLDLFLDSELRNFGDFLCGHVPYIIELYDFLSCFDTLQEKEKEYSRLLERMDQYQQSEKVKKLQHSLSELDQENATLGEVVALLRNGVSSSVQDQLIPTDRTTLASRRRVLKQKIQSVKQKIQRLSRVSDSHILSLEGVQDKAKVLQESISELKTKLDGIRIKRLPTIDEFTLGIYNSLGVNNDFSVSKKSPTLNPESIKERLLTIFSDLLSDIFSIDGISFSNIANFKHLVSDESYDLLSDQYTHLSQRKISTFFDQLRLITPRVSLITIPDLSGVYSTSSIKSISGKLSGDMSQETSKDVHTSDLETINNKAQIKKAFERNIKECEGQLLTFRVYWEGILINAKKRKLGLLKAKELREKGLIPPSAYRQYSLDAILALIDETNQNIVQVNDVLKKRKLCNNLDEYNILQKKYMTLRSKLKRIR